MMDEIETDYNTFWRDIVERDGALDAAQVKRELYDYHVVMREVSLVYERLTGGRISKPNTEAETVIAVVEDRMNEDTDAAPGEDVYRLQDTVKDIQAIIGGVPDGMTTADAVQARISFGDELIAWAGQPEHATRWANAYFEYCRFCRAHRDVIQESELTHADNCLHLRARALRDSE